VTAIVREIHHEYELGAPHNEIISLAKERGLDGDTADHIIGKLCEDGESIYQTTEREQPHHRPL
jgi:DNA replicative helicase MCM subunit Mcm2 (Cdc46/Mcm family)